MKKVLIILILASVLAGCGTVDRIAALEWMNWYKPYGGVSQDIKWISNGNGWAVLDLPFSFAADTVCIPFLMLRWIVSGY